MKKLRYSNKQLLICGNIWELRSYPHRRRIDPLPQSQPPFRGSNRQSRGSQRTESSIYRSRQELGRLINSNFGFHLKPNGKPYKPLFITFTFREKMTDSKKANSIFTKFIQRFNYTLFRIKKSILKYVVVIEFQKRGAVHYHAIFFNVPYTKDLKVLVPEIWQEGFVKVESIKKNIHDVGFYLTKYMSKEQLDKRLIGKKCYFSSRNLRRPVLVKEEQKIEDLMRFVKPSQKFCDKVIPATDYSPEHLLEKFNVNNPGFVEAALDLIAKGRYLDSKL